MINFCTYFDKNYLSKFLNLKDSIDRFNFEHTFYILSLDSFVTDFFKKNKFQNIKIINLNELENYYVELKVAKKNRDLIEYYFTLSPFLPRFIYEKRGVKQITYLDSDFYFFKSPEKLIYRNYESSVVLIKQNVKEKYGLYNVGWIYFNFEFEETFKITKKWGTQCIDLCQDLPSKNSYADQKYLDTWVKELNYAKVLHPEYTCLSPWDSNLSLEENSANMIAFHFHALEISSNEFSTGFNKYNKKISNELIEKIYKPYIKNLLLLEKKYNISSSSIRNKRKKFFSKILIKLRTIKSYVKKIYYEDKFYL